MAPFNFRTSKSRSGRETGPAHGLWTRIEPQLRYVAAFLFGLIFFLCVVGIPCLLVFTSIYGLGDTVRKRAEALLGGQFYRVSIERVLFSPTRGFILSHVEAHDLSPSGRLIVSANRAAISVNMNSILRRQPSLERIYLRDATLDIPLGRGEEPRLRLDRVSGLGPGTTRARVGCFGPLRAERAEEHHVKRLGYQQAFGHALAAARMATLPGPGRARSCQWQRGELLSFRGGTTVVISSI